ISISKRNSRKVIIQAESPGGVVFTGNSSIRIWNTQSLALSGFLFKDVKTKNLIVLHNCQEVEVYNNYFQRCGNDAMGSIIRIESQSSFNNIHTNTLEGNRAMGVVISANPDAPSQCVNNFIHHNRF